MSESGVKVRINASGRRLVGTLHLPPEVRRTSDLLDGPESFLAVHTEQPPPRGEGSGIQVVAKDAISYVETLEEPGDATQTAPEGSFCSVVAEMRDPETQIIGEVFLPAERSLADVLNDRRHFINLRNVHFSNFVERYPYLAVGKKQIILLKG